MNTEGQSQHPEGMPAGHPGAVGGHPGGGHPGAAPSGHPAGIPMGEHPANMPAGHPGGHPAHIPMGHPAGIPTGHPDGHPAGIPMGHPAGIPMGGHPGAMPPGHPAGIPIGHPPHIPIPSFGGKTKNEAGGRCPFGHDKPQETSKKSSLVCPPGMRVGLIWAEDRSHVIGNGTSQPWNVPADLKNFQLATTGYPVIMGRKTFETLDGPLEGRTMVVISTQQDYQAKSALVVHSPQEALDAVSTEPIVWVIGGGEIFAEFISVADYLMVSYIDIDAKGDVYAPEIDPDMWIINRAASDRFWRPQSGDAQWRIVVYARRNG